MTDKHPPLQAGAERDRIRQNSRREVNWSRWGPYLSERQWGTVREDYSADGAAWEYLPHGQARSKAYRWGEDGIGGICDRHQYICVAVGLWNGRDPFLKERLFGLTGNQGNHGEDVKEQYWYLDSTPTHSYMKYLYKYPQAEYPYDALVEESARRGPQDPEFELLDTGIFDEDRYFDVFVEYAKADFDDVYVRITAVNRGPEAAEIHLLPTIWFRNTWSWGDKVERPELRAGTAFGDVATIDVKHPYYGRRRLLCGGSPSLLFTDNDSNAQRLWGSPNGSRFVKDGINDHVVGGAHDTVNPDLRGTKAAAHYQRELEPGGSFVVNLRLTDDVSAQGFQDQVFAQRRAEADAFFDDCARPRMSDDAARVFRQAIAGMLWTKQFFHFDVARWLEGDPGATPPPAERKHGRNADWPHLYNADVISMPDKWEYPWYAAWDLAFHCVPLALVDPGFAKDQLTLFLREWYQHPNGQIPAYEWAFGDVNPPVHAWAVWRTYKIDRRVTGQADRMFLERAFHKLLLNFTWWVNRKDAEGHNVFQGGFLGLDNIGVFDRSAPLPTGGFLEQSDGTSWMGMYCLNMLAIALELSRENHAYADVASKFFEHFVYIAHAMNNVDCEGIRLWDDEDGFYYDVLHTPEGAHRALKVRSLVGLIPLVAAEVIEPESVAALPGFKKRMRWFTENRPELLRDICAVGGRSERGSRRMLSIVGRGRLERVLSRMLDEEEFLSPHGIRSISRYHKKNPFLLSANGEEYRVDYEPAESRNNMFGGNSNWRGPVWFPINFLLIEALQRLQHFYGDELKVECPTGSGNRMSMGEVAAELSRRLCRLFLRDEGGRRPTLGAVEKLQADPHFRDYLLFHEYFHGETGAGLGASHQTGWTGLVAKLLDQSGDSL